MKSGNVTQRQNLLVCSYNMLKCNVYGHMKLLESK